MFARAFTRPLALKGATQPPRVQLNSFRNYATSKKNGPPRIRYLFYTFLFSTAVLYFAGSNVDKRPKPKTSFVDENELREYEKSTGLKRRYKLINSEKNENYRFFVVPYVHTQSTLDHLVKKIKESDSAREVKVIDPAELIEAEKKDESKRYCYILQDLEKENKPLPKGLITAVIKEEISQFLNTRSGTFDTNFVIKNYPQSTDEAIKFENDISDVKQCLVLHFDIINELPKYEDSDASRSINNVVGYFKTVGKTTEIANLHDSLDDKFKEVMMEGGLA